jgi:hypothetical protein
MPMQTTYETAPAGNISGVLMDPLSADIKSMYSAEASDEIPFGACVEWASATDGKAAKLPNAETDKICGLVLFSHSYETGDNGELGTTGVKPGGKLHVLRAGRVKVKCRTGCAPGDRLWVRAVAGGGTEFLGAPENADDTTDTVDCTAQGEWESYAAAGGYAVLRVDFTNK